MVSPLASTGNDRRRRTAVITIAHAKRGNLEYVIPFVRMFELKMSDQQPSDYQIPVSQYSPKSGLHLVA